MAAIRNHQAYSPIICGLISDLVICKHMKKYGHTSHKIPLLRLGVSKQYKLKNFVGLNMCHCSMQICVDRHGKIAI